MPYEENKSITNLLVEEIKKFFSLQADYARLVLVEKLAILLSAMVLVLILLLLALIGGFYLLIALHSWLEPLFGRALSAMILVGLILIGMWIIYALRERLINKPVLRFVAKLFLSSSDKDQ